MADGPIIYPRSYFGPNPLEQGLDNFMKSYSWAQDTQKKSDLLERQLRETKYRIGLMDDENTKKTGGGVGDDAPTTQNLPAIGGSGSDGGSSGGGEQPTIGGVGGSNNPEIDTNNFAGMRNPNAPIGGGPRSNPAGWQQFTTPEDGINGIVHQLDRYVSGATTGKPLTTLNQIISTWAPPHENNTKLLIDRASQIMGVAPDAQLDWNNPDVKARLVEAMIRNEQGGMLHPKAVQGIQGVFGQSWQPYQTPQQQAAAPGQFNQAVPQVPTHAPLAYPTTAQGNTPMAIGGNTPATTAAAAPAPPASAPPATAPSPPATGAPPASGSNVQYTAPGGSFSPPQQTPRAPNYSPRPRDQQSYLPDQQQQSQIAALAVPQQYDPRNSGLYPQGSA
jgi:hypothetical protein